MLHGSDACYWQNSLQFVDLHTGSKTETLKYGMIEGKYCVMSHWPLTVRLTGLLSFPASLMIWQVYSPAWDLSTLKSSKITWLSFREKLQARPDTISLVPLNHFSLRGALPFTMAEKVTLEPGMASTGCGGTTKDGGSGYKQIVTDQTWWNLSIKLFKALEELKSGAELKSFLKK